MVAVVDSGARLEILGAGTEYFAKIQPTSDHKSLRERLQRTSSAACI